MKPPKWARDELILALDLYIRSGRKILEPTHSEVMDLSGLLNALPIHDPQKYMKFRNPSGVSMKLGNFRSIDPNHPGGLSRIGKGDRAVWDEFSHDPIQLTQVAKVIRNVVEAGEVTPLDQKAIEEDNEEAVEGRILLRLHKVRERNPTLSRKKKQSALKKIGRLACEVCGFDFKSIYGNRGEGFAECHHRVPLNEFRTSKKTTLNDLAILCANCHRMIHRSPSISVEELKNQLLK